MQKISPLLSEVQSFVSRLFQKQCMQQYTYHNFLHTQNVVAAATYIAQCAGMEDEALEMLQLAAWFHDTGYYRHWKGHEATSMEIASGFLRRKGYPQAAIATVASCIGATRMPQRPLTRMEKILCDADLINLSQCNYLESAHQLRMEMEQMRGIVLTNSEFFLQEIGFLSRHRYHLRLTEQLFGQLKANNVHLLRELLQQADPMAA